MATKAKHAKKLNGSVNNLANALRDVIVEAMDDVKDDLTTKMDDNTKYLAGEIGNVRSDIKSVNKRVNKLEKR